MIDPTMASTLPREDLTNFYDSDSEINYLFSEESRYLNKKELRQTMINLLTITDAVEVSTVIPRKPPISTGQGSFYTFVACDNAIAVRVDYSGPWNNDKKGEGKIIAKERKVKMEVKHPENSPNPNTYLLEAVESHHPFVHRLRKQVVSLLRDGVPVTPHVVVWCWTSPGDDYPTPRPHGNSKMRKTPYSKFDRSAMKEAVELFKEQGISAEQVQEQLAMDGKRISERNIRRARSMAQPCKTQIKPPVSNDIVDVGTTASSEFSPTERENAHIDGEEDIELYDESCGPHGYDDDDGIQTEGHQSFNDVRLPSHQTPIPDRFLEVHIPRMKSDFLKNIGSKWTIIPGWGNSLILQNTKDLMNVVPLQIKENVVFCGLPQCKQGSCEHVVYVLSNLPGMYDKDLVMAETDRFYFGAQDQESFRESVSFTRILTTPRKRPLSSFSKNGASTSYEINPEIAPKRSFKGEI